eukprot:SAG31_NODE_3019_length_4784_cov_2.199360_3_plen_66_part_00
MSFFELQFKLHIMVWWYRCSASRFSVGIQLSYVVAREDLPRISSSASNTKRNNGGAHGWHVVRDR